MKSEPTPPAAPPAATIHQTNNQELLSACKALGSAVNPGLLNGEPLQPYAIIPQGYKFEPIPLASENPLPDHIQQAVKLGDAQSFIAYIKAFKTHTTRIFATLPDLENIEDGGGCFKAFLDYHEGGSDPAARRKAHVAFYPVPLSLEFKTWLKKNTAGQSQMDFISFIEANAGDVVTPDSATLMEIALNFESKTTAVFQSKVTRVTGGRNLVFQEQIEASGGAAGTTTGQITVPETLTLRLPIFEGGKVYELKARMEYRPANGRLTITYHLQRPQDAVRAAVAELRAEISEAVSVDILTGSLV